MKDEKRAWLLTNAILSIVAIVSFPFLVGCPSPTTAPPKDESGLIDGDNVEKHVVLKVRCVGVDKNGTPYYNIAVEERVYQSSVNSIRIDACEQKPMTLDIVKHSKGGIDFILHIHNAGEIEYDSPRTININKEDK